ncbi:MAG TPA: hypothetical protein VMV72_18620 [Verrucomicrobiae bacterium]|nr:hypothetical protein [Verrucomicrobiae bacterium]
MKRESSVTIRVHSWLPLCAVLLSPVFCLLSPPAHATNLYPVGVGNGATTASGDMLVFPGATLSVSNVPGGGRVVTLSGLVGSGGGTQTVLVSSNCIAIVNLGGGTNSIAVDTNCLVSELNVPGLTNSLVAQASLLAVSNYLATTLTSSGVTNGLATINFVNTLSNCFAVGQASLLANINSVTNGFIANVVSGGNSGNGGVSVSGNTATITFPIGASVFGTNSVAGINSLVSNVTINVSGNLKIATTASTTGGTITIAATAPLTNYDCAIFHNFSPATSNDSIGFFYGNSYGTNGTGTIPNLDTTDGITNRLYSVATCTSTNTQNGVAFCKLMVPPGQTNLTALGMHFKIDQAQNSNIAIQASSGLLGASTIFTAQVASVGSDVVTNLQTAGTWLTNNLAGQRLDLRWNVAISTSNVNATAQVGVGQDFKWIQQ